MLDFLYALRRNLLNPDLEINLISFLLDPRNQNIRINNKLYSDFTKYDLMNALQNIVEKGLFFPESYFAENPNESVKKIIQAYTRERECILELTENIYERNLKREL